MEKCRRVGFTDDSILFKSQSSSAGWREQSLWTDELINGYYILFLDDSFALAAKNRLKEKL